MLYIYLFENIFFTVRYMQHRRTTRNCIDYIKTETLYHYVFQPVIHCNMTTSINYLGKHLGDIPPIPNAFNHNMATVNSFFFFKAFVS